MALRRPGRPREKQAAMDAQLRGLGGFDQVLADMVEAGLASRKMVDRLFALTGVQVAPNTIRRWAHELHARHQAATGGVGEPEGTVSNP